MAKVTKSTRDIIDVDQEIEKVTSSKKKEQGKKTQKKESKKKSENSKKEKGGVFQFFKEVRKEMSKVKWPSRKDMVKYSVATISFVIFFAIFFYVIEIIMALLKAWV